MTNWFHTDEAYSLFNGDKECSIVRVSTEHCLCVAVLYGPFWCRRAIVQGGVAWNDSVSPDVVNKELVALLEQLKAGCRKKHCVYVELRNFSDYSQFVPVFEQAGFAYKPHYDIHLPVASCEAMQSAMHESKQRALKKALAEGCTWREATNENDVKEFYHLLKTLYHTKVRRPLPSEDFFLRAWHSGMRVLVTTEHSGTVNGGVLMPVLESTQHGQVVAYEWYICGGIMSTWAMMDWGNLHKVGYIDMMGAGEPDVPYGVRDFKLQMGGQLKQYGRFVWVNRRTTYTTGKFIMKIISR